MKIITPCMPPLLPEEIEYSSSIPTSFAGSAGESIIKTYFLKKNINVGMVVVDDGIDVLIKQNNEWVPGQVKKVVYRNKIDNAEKKKGNDVRRATFAFNFQGGCAKDRKQLTPNDVKYYYHVLFTQYRELIWLTSVNVIPLRKNGTFIHSKDATLDRESTGKGSKPGIDFRKTLVSAQWDQKLIDAYPEFFNIKPNPLKQFLFNIPELT